MSIAAIHHGDIGPTLMYNSYNKHYFIIQKEVDTIWKSFEECAPNRAFNYWKRIRIFGKATLYDAHFQDEAVS